MMRRSLPSVHDLAELVTYKFANRSNITVRYGTYIVSTASFVGHLMSTSKGRDKICSLIQYIAQFYYECINNSNILTVQELHGESAIISALIAIRIRKSMSSGRKIFRFLKFVDEIGHIHKVAFKSKKRSLPKFLTILGHIASAVYYFLDNTIWAANIGVLTSLVSQEKIVDLKQKKDSFSLTRSISNLIFSILKVRRNQRKVKEYIKLIHSYPNKIITSGDPAYETVRNLIRTRRKIRFRTLDVIHGCLRIIMLYRSLELPHHRILHPVFVAFCGVMSSGISVFKAAIEKETFLKIDIPEETKTMDTSRSYSALFDPASAV
eukprot:TRINITY_DN10603_c0_g2_i2.p1 TRINITY_DN10603_c0_g2~~TRINITY_DN10603_c0_g2_i2.p1  ORF type:complete len:322 (-),score=51.80 TRINITY_DN10603_c0_g2_i2:53-1018(-)